MPLIEMLVSRHRWKLAATRNAWRLRRLQALLADDTLDSKYAANSAIKLAREGVSGLDRITVRKDTDGPGWLVVAYPDPRMDAPNGW